MSDPTATFIGQFQNVIGEDLRSAASGAVLDSVDPSTGRVWAQVPRSGEADVAEAVAAAAGGFDKRWRPLPALARARHLRQLADVVAGHARELAELEARDNGRLITETTTFDLPACVEMLHYFAGAADKIAGDTVEIGPTSFNFTLREPIGVVGLIVPWNAPLSITCAKLGAALAAGNSVVVKPAEQASCSVLRLGELALEALPAGVMNVVSGLGEEAGDALVCHPGVGRISFTGSTDTARIIAGRSAPLLRPLHFELGGKSPNIVFADADLDLASVGVSTMSIFTGNAGQTCIAGSRILAHQSVADELVGRIGAIAGAIVLGPPLDPDTTMGPIISTEQFERVRSYLAVGGAENAELVFGGGSGAQLFPSGNELGGGYYVAPTLFRSEHNDLRICQEEIFGPVTVVIPFRDDDHALELANATRYGLAAGVWTKDLSRAHRFVRSLRVGSVWVNTYRKIHWAMPFGGVKDSGFGRDSGWESILENTQLKTAWVDLP
jgi:(Z)-2-((N-methylformamido)methylene)-5-hydroxybutyrolactone dehydrogenase